MGQMADARPRRRGETRHSGPAPRPSTRSREDSIMNRTARSHSRRSRTIAQLTVLLVATAPIGVAQAEPDTNIQKPGHKTSLSVAGGSGAEVGSQISRPLGAS
jgi:hypothetical protein